jgi:hypothetical protein
MVNTVLHAEALEKEVEMSYKHSMLLLSKFDRAFAQYHNEIHEMQAKRDDLIRKNKSL